MDNVTVIHHYCVACCDDKAGVHTDALAANKGKRFFFAKYLKKVGKLLKIKIKIIFICGGVYKDGTVWC